MRKLWILFSLILLESGLILNAQQQITGVVKSTDEGSALPGVSIQVKGTNIGTTTDNNGKYSINVPDSSDILVFSFIGMKNQEIEIGNQNVINIDMEMLAYGMNEVVVTAFGISRERKSLTYSVTELSSDEIVEADETNIINALNGKVAGVMINNSSGLAGSSSRIIIRGISSLRENNQPLFVIDGIPVNNEEPLFDEEDEDLALFYGSTANTGIDFDPNQIEKVSVLKGAAATALYGSRAANGVILITTKRGVKGQKKPEVTFYSRYGMDKIIPHKIQEKYGQGIGGEYIDGETEKTNFIWGPRLDTTNLPTYDRWDIFRTGNTFENSVNITGGTDNSAYLLNMALLNQKGTVPDNNFNRKSVTANFQTDLSSKLSFQAKINYIQSKNDRIPEGNSLNTIMWTVLNVPPTYNLYPGTDENGEQRLWRTPFRNNAYWLLDNVKYNDIRDRVLPSFKLEYKILPWMKFRGNVGIDYYASHAVYYENMGNRDVYPEGQILETTRRNREFNSDIILEVEKDLSTNFRLNAFIGNNINTFYYNYTKVQGVGFIIPDFYNLSNTTDNISSEGTEEKRITSIYGQAQLTYRNYLFLSVTGRNDWSSTLPPSSNSYFYPSVSLSTIISDMIDMPTEYISLAKIRTSYALLGNDAPPYSLSTRYVKIDPGDGMRGIINFPFQGIGSYKESNIKGNPALKPEISKEFELGVEIRILKNRLGLDIAYYNKTSVNQIFSAPLPPETGFRQHYVNAAEILNKGIEILIDATPVLVNQFKWDISVNYTKNNNEILSLTEGVEDIRLAGFTSPGIFIKANQPYGVIWGTRYARDENGNILVYDDGFPIMDDETGPIGNAMPDWLGGLRNTFSYRGLSFSFLIDTRQGGQIFNMDEYYTKYYGTSWDTRDRETPILIKGVTESGEPNTVEITDHMDYWTYLSSIDEANVQDASFIRLRDISLGYKIPGSILSNVFIEKINLNISARNIWLKTDDSFTGSDPENSLYGSANGQGFTNFAIPSSKSYNFSIRLTF